MMFYEFFWAIFRVDWVINVFGFVTHGETFSLSAATPFEIYASNILGALMLRKVQFFMPS